MSWLSLKRLLPTRKFWRAFTKKVLPLKLHKLNRSSSKANKKPKNRSYKTSKKLSWPISLSVQPKKFKNKPKNLTRYQKRLPPVFVDQLFVEPISAVVAEAGSTSKEKSTSLKTSEISDDKSRPAESCSEDTSDDHMNMVTSSRADVWDSIVLASPQTQGIDERAEEFIARFRAQMRHQEMLARRL